MEFGYQGGLARAPRTTFQGSDGWSHPHGDQTFFIQSHGCARLFVWDSLTLLIRGYARPVGSSATLDLDTAAEEARAHYLEFGDLAVEGLEGNFTLALLDAHAGRVLLYRNLIGTGCTYYRDYSGSFLFGSNLADLVEASDKSPTPNRDALPAFFLYRAVPGRETLFDGFYRLMPGEHVVWDGRQVLRQQWQTSMGSRRTCLPVRDCLDALDCTTEQVLHDVVRQQPKTANLLSGAMDDAYLQARWSEVYTGEDPLPSSWSLAVDHPAMWSETDQALTAARTLGTRHTLVSADGPFADYLLESIAVTGTVPKRTHEAYFLLLARALAARGMGAGLCAEGADSHFGHPVVGQLHNAQSLRIWIPGNWPRGAAGRLAGMIGGNDLRDLLRIANGFDNYTDESNLVNLVDASTDWSAAVACFGKKCLSDAAAARRELLNRHEIDGGPFDRVHGIALLGTTLDAAAQAAEAFNASGVELFCPFLDSRMLRLVVELPQSVRFPSRRHNNLLRRGLARQSPRYVIPSLPRQIGQPILDWLAPGGPLRARVDAIGSHEFIDDAILQHLRERPNWFLYNLLCYDVWHKTFIEKTLPRGKAKAATFRTDRSEVQYVR